MSRKLASSVLLLLALGAHPHALRAQDAFTARVDSIAKTVLARTGVPSASVAVVRGGRLAYAHAYGEARLHPEEAATPGMRYSIGSISKQFAAASILMLQQDGKLSLDEPVARFLPRLTDAKKVTIREVLSHTSGYEDYWPQDYVPPEMLRPTTPRQILDRWAEKPLDFQPGTKWQYSNTNYVIVGMIVQKASGMPFFDFIRTHILQPLGMRSAFDVDRKHLARSDPTGYVRYALGPLRPAPEEGPGWMFAAGELAMTASDLAKWDISMIDESLMSHASYDQMERDVLLKDGVSSGYGLGVEVGMQSGHRLISHTGEVSGFVSANYVYPDDRDAVVVLTNEDASSAASTIARAVGAMLFTKQDTATAGRTAQAKAIFEGLQKGTIDRSLFTADANAYFSRRAIADFASSLAPLGTPLSFAQVGEAKRGGMLLRVFIATFGRRELRIWTYQTTDGKLEQYQVAAVG